MKKYILIVISLFTLLSAQNKIGSDNSLTVFTTIDYKSYVGNLQKELSDTITIKQFDGYMIELAKSDILNTYKYDGRVRNGKLQRKDPNASFYLFSPSAFPVENGKIYIKDFSLFFPSINFGLANIFSTQIGAFWYPGMDYQNIPYVGNLKVTAFETDFISLAGGFTYVKLPEIQKERIYSTGYAFVTGTLGDRYNHASISAGWGYLQKESEWKREEKPILVAAGNLRLLDFVSIVTENWFFPDEASEDALLTIAMRFFGRQVAVDLGVSFSINSVQKEKTPIPILNISYHLR